MPPRAVAASAVVVSAIAIVATASCSNVPAVREDLAPSEAEYPRRTVIRNPAQKVMLTYNEIGHLPGLGVHLNGVGPFPFVLDSGSSGSAVIDSELAADLDLEVVGETPVGDPSGHNVQTWRQVRVRNLTLGDVAFEDFIADVLPGDAPHSLAESRGILGIGLFRDCLLRLDHPARTLQITKGALPAPDGRDVISFTFTEGIPSITLGMDSVWVPAHLDTGSGSGFLLPTRVVERLPMVTEPRVVGRARTLMNEFEIKEARVEATLHLGRYEYRQPMIQFSSIFPVANVGSQVLRDFALTFDIRNRRLRLERPRDSSSE